MLQPDVVILVCLYTFTKAASLLGPAAVAPNVLTRIAAWLTLLMAAFLFVEVALQTAARH